MPSFFKERKPKKKRQQDDENQTTDHSIELIQVSLSGNLNKIKQKTGNSSDVVIREIKMGGNSDIKTAIVYVEGIVDNQSIQEYLLQSMMKDDQKEEVNQHNVIDLLSEDMMTVGNVSSINNWDDLFLALMAGDTLVLVDGIGKALSASTKGGEKRSISESGTQMVVRGPKGAFIESIGTNTAMVRRIIKTPDLWTESLKVGRATKTDVAIMYIHGIANDKVVEEIRQRLHRIDIDSILESGYIEQLIEDETMTPFPTIYNTERPDVVAGNLLEGRIAIFVDGTPFVLIAPAVFMQFFQSAEDYYTRFDIATSIRLLRIFMFLISIIAPATYVAVTTFHQEMVPTTLIVAIAAQREAVPFPAFVEALVMELTFEILREAGIRLPKAIGSAVSIVGALVIGQAAVQASIVSPAMVIIVSITAIASFATPSFDMAISARLIRFLFMLGAASFGFYGIILTLLMMVVHLCSLRSFGVPYMAPFAPFIPVNMGDTVVRLPWWTLRQRPRLVSTNTVREGTNQRPQPPASRGMVNRDFEEGDNNEA
ncbi:spore germination protein [Priestia megaterium]|jgi:spore germination protein KA|uniref:spore germination protein n=1 Tax=Priestia TaxID=2800373 RepID=UPI000B50E94E|nr:MULTISPECIES: spore germination protein [Priestia]MBU8756879.1 spore germination protein [Priestia megaterium]MBY0026007.1 spore germination protein [Priestia aryabhattai]OVE34280.1 spore germination protein [Priestia aryabhattai]QSF36084.1 spore germination protein [Priestia megaterium]